MASLQITIIKKHEKELEKAATHDFLTGLPNRNLLYKKFKNPAPTNEDTKLAIVHIDLDGFKNINDSYGHTSGDIFLKKIAKRMSDQLRKSDILVRIGGDEFIAVLDNLATRKQCESIISRLLKSAAQPINVKDKELSVTASIGVAITPDDSNNIDYLLRLADNAMYFSKKNGKNKYVFYSDIKKL